jgi:hypothetical protein
MSLLILFQGARTYQSSAAQVMSGTEIVFPMVEEEIEPDDDEVFEIIKRIVKYL